MSKGRQIGENFDDYRTRVIDPISDSFCGAKWYNATIWLGHGGTASCHHPPAHNIDKEEIKTNPSAIHNTRHKKKMRQMMQEGTRPKECEYCWKIEDMEKDALEYCAKSLMKAIQHEDTEKFLKSFKKLIHLSESHMKDDDNDDY